MRILEGKWILGLVFFAVLAIGCKSTSKATNTVKKQPQKGSIFDKIVKSTDIGDLVQDMSGTYVSTALPNDSTYQERTLRIVPIWKTKPGKFLYVEQGLTSNEASPEQQFIYKLKSDENGGFEIHRYGISMAIDCMWAALCI